MDLLTLTLYSVAMDAYEQEFFFKVFKNDSYVYVF